MKEAWGLTVKSEELWSWPRVMAKHSHSRRSVPLSRSLSRTPWTQVPHIRSDLDFSYHPCSCTDVTAEEVPLPSTKAEILESVVLYMQHHGGEEPPIIEKPLRSKVMKEVCKDKWDADFIDKIGEKRQQLYDLILVMFSSLEGDSKYNIITGGKLHGR